MNALADTSANAVLLAANTDEFLAVADLSANGLDGAEIVRIANFDEFWFLPALRVPALSAWGGAALMALTLGSALIAARRRAAGRSAARMPTPDPTMTVRP